MFVVCVKNERECTRENAYDIMMGQTKFHSLSSPRLFFSLKYFSLLLFNFNFVNAYLKKIVILIYLCFKTISSISQFLFLKICIKMNKKSITKHITGVIQFTKLNILFYAQLHTDHWIHLIDHRVFIPFFWTYLKFKQIYFSEKCIRLTYNL